MHPSLNIKVKGQVHTDPLNFSNRQRTITDKKSAAEMLTLVFIIYDCGIFPTHLSSKARGWIVLSFVWLLLRSGRNNIRCGTKLIYPEDRILWQPFRRRSSYFLH